MVVTGDKAPSPIVNLPEPPVAIVITSDPEKVIEVFVSPSPDIESNCIDPTFVKFESPRSSVPVTVRLPVMSVLALSFIDPVPDGSIVKSALLGDAMVEPTMLRSPTETLDRKSG